MHRPVAGLRIELRNRRLNLPGLPATLFHGRPFCSNALLYLFVKQRFMLQTCKAPWLAMLWFSLSLTVVSGIGTLKSSQKWVPSLSPRDLFAFSSEPLDLTINTLRGTLTRVKL